ncbi:hypothetical protein GGF31_005074 [Allomyces arbusculus]|nr:hypothetical protein GGF31_005074 [Allomyces arbusculus]
MTPGNTPAPEPAPAPQPPTDPAAAAAAIKKLHPRAYLARFLAAGVRPDARQPSHFRTLRITPSTVSTAHGSALANLGQTTVLCAIKAEVAVPAFDKPGRGFLVVNLDLPPLCSGKHRPGPPVAEAQALAHQLAGYVESAPIVDLAGLCIAERSACWVLYADLLCLNDDGNVLDAAVAALVAALRNVRLPRAEYDDDDGTVRASTDPTNRPVTLPLLRTPVACSFAVVDNHLLADPTADEAALASASVTVLVDADRTADSDPLLALTKRGGVPLSKPQLAQCIALARDRARAVSKAGLLA